MIHQRFQIRRFCIKHQVQPIMSPSLNHKDKVKMILLKNVKHYVIAEQLTLIMHQIYVKIPFDSIENNLRNIYNNYYYLNYTKIFNQIVVWVQYSILVNKDTKQRAKIIKKWIKCCYYLLSMHNFHGLVAVHCALKSNSVFSGKLKRAWFKHKNIIKKKHHQKFEQISKIVSHNGNYCILRKTMNETASKYPLLPYIGIFKKDFQYFNEYNNNKMIDSLLIQYDEYKKGQYISNKFIHNPLIETWIHYQLGETLLIDVVAINQMSDNVHDLDEKED